MQLTSQSPSAHFAPPPSALAPADAPSPPLSDAEFDTVQRAVEHYLGTLLRLGVHVHVRRDFDRYVSIRRAHGDHHLNQAFDPTHTNFHRRDFWLLVEDREGTEIATFCMRTIEVANFYSIIQSQSLWFNKRPHLVDPRFIVSCTIPPFGGLVAHGGGMWVRKDRRGTCISWVLLRLGRALALRNNSGMILDNPDPKRLGIKNYGLARVELMTDGWFPPEGRTATVHLCHADRQECIQSLTHPIPAALAA